MIIEYLNCFKLIIQSSTLKQEGIQTRNRISMEDNLNTLSSGKLPSKQTWTLHFLAVITILFPLVNITEGFVVKNTNTLEKPSNADQSTTNDSTFLNICLTEGCGNAASEIKQNLNESVDPCDDFYLFSCGGWIEKNEILEDQIQVSVFTKLSEQISSELQILLEKNLTGLEPDHVIKTKKMYNSCMDLERIEAEGSTPLQNALKSLGGWPVVEGKEWRGKDFDWMDTIIKMRKLGYGHNVLLDMSIIPDPRNSEVHIINIDQANLGMMDLSYLLKGLEDNSTAAYYKLMQQVAEKLGADSKIAETDMMNVLNFQISLANYSTPKEMRRNMSRMYNKYDLKKFQELVPGINWTKYLNSLINDPISEMEPLLIPEPSFIIQLAELINITDKRVIANYLLWRVAYNALPILSKDWSTLMQEYTTVLSGNTKEIPRCELCVGTVSQSMDIAVSSYYVRNYFEYDSRDRAQELVNYIQKEFYDILSNVNWMDPKTKEKALLKATSIKSHIGYPDELLNDTIISQLYENLKITEGSHYDNTMLVKKWRFDKAYSILRVPNIGPGWMANAVTHVINAFYEQRENSIKFPAGILQNPFFNKRRPRYLNFGAIGTIIGHEITHGFDDQGRQFDVNGNNVNWWEAKTDESFKEKAECIINQYSNYTAENGLQLNGINTQGENIADNGGLKHAYRAYQSWVMDHGPEVRLPELNYTQNQLFWISAAGLWCNRLRLESLETMMTSDNHSPAQFRVIGPMSNLPEFSEDFQCKPDSKMNPRNKCEVW